MTISVINLVEIYLPPTMKFGQGNIFRSVCQEFCPGWEACVAGGVCGSGACMAVGHAWWGHAW